MACIELFVKVKSIRFLNSFCDKKTVFVADPVFGRKTLQMLLACVKNIEASTLLNTHLTKAAALNCAKTCYAKENSGYLKDHFQGFSLIFLFTLVKMR